MRSMVGKSTQPEDQVTGTPESDTCHLRERLAELTEGSPKLDLDHPDALDLAAAIQVAAHDALYGSISALGGHRSDHKWRKTIGAHGCCLNAIDLAYLAVLRTPATRKAVRSILALLKSAVDDSETPSGTISGRVAQLAHEATEIGVVLNQLQEDGLDDDDKRRLRSELADVERAVSAVRAMLNGPVR